MGVADVHTAGAGDAGGAMSAWVPRRADVAGWRVRGGADAGMRRRFAWAVAACVIASTIVLAPVAAIAHDVSFSYADLAWQGRQVRVRLELHRNDVALALGVAAPESLMSPRVLARLAPRVDGLIAAGFQVRGDGAPLALAIDSLRADPAKRALEAVCTGDARRPIGRLEVRAQMFPSNTLHETFLTVRRDGQVLAQKVLTADDPAFEHYADGATGLLAVAGTFIGAGIHHIFIGPDHILFIVGLMLLGGGLLRVLKVATAFTLAHSITLALAATGMVNVPSRVAEPLIALSIVVVGIESLRGRNAGRDHRMALAFGFGLVHGLGFAGVLREFGLPREALAASLVAFNLGVELGQACIILAVAPLLALLRARRPRVAWRTVTFAACAIIVAGAYWFVQRVWAG